VLSSEKENPRLPGERTDTLSTNPSWANFSASPSTKFRPFRLFRGSKPPHPSPTTKPFKSQNSKLPIPSIQFIRGYLPILQISTTKTNPPQKPPPSKAPPQSSLPARPPSRSPSPPPTPLRASSSSPPKSIHSPPLQSRAPTTNQRA